METITIPKAEYEELIRDQEFLRNLEAAGVDNWEGYHFGYGDSDEFIYDELDMSEEMWNKEISKFDDEDLDDDPEELPTP